MAPWYKEFANGFRDGWNGTLGVMSKVPVVGSVYGAIPKLHAGGQVKKTGNYRLKANEVVLNKTQQTALRKAKTAKGKQKVINDVKKRRAKPMKRKYK
jgi:hypothetical protein